MAGTDSVSVALQLLAESHLHHLYVVDVERKPVGVLTLTDLLRGLAECVTSAAPVDAAAGGGSAGAH